MGSDDAPLLTVTGKELRLLRKLGTRTPATHAALWMGMGPAGAAELVVLQREPLEADDAERILTRAQALKRLRHANVARCREVAQIGDELIVVTDYVEGVTLQELHVLARAAGKRIPIPFIVRVLLDVLNGLGALHGLRDKAGKALGRFHGDLAPDNVIVGIDGAVKILGFHHGEWEPERGTEALRFMAPEILLHDEDGTDARADIYAVAAILWEAIADKPLFAETTTSAILARHLAGRIEALAPPADPPWLPALAAIATRGISADPETRHRSAIELTTDLRKLVGAAIGATSEVGALVRELAGEAIAMRRAALFPQRATKPFEPPHSPKQLDPHAAAKPIEAKVEPMRTSSPTRTDWLRSPRKSATAIAAPKPIQPAPPPMTGVAPKVDAVPPPPAGAIEALDWSDLQPIESERPAPLPILSAPKTSHFAPTMMEVAPPTLPATPAAPPVVPSLDDSPRSPPDVGDPFATSDPFSVAGDRVTSPGDSSARDAPPPPVLPPAIADVTHEPVGIDAGAEAPIPVAKRRRRAIVLALMLFGIVFLLFVGIRAITRSGHTVATEEEPSTSGHKTWVAAPKTVASSPATGAAGATEATTAANTVTTAATTSPSTNASTTATGASTMASTGGESSAATAATSATGLSPTAATGVSGGGAPAPTGTGTVHAKPKPTYDPLGI